MTPERAASYAGRMKRPRLTTLALPALGFTLGLTLILGQPPAAVSLNTLEGTCPAPTADPLSVCYDPTMGASEAAGAALRLHMAVAIAAEPYHTWKPGTSKVIPTWVIGHDGAGHVSVLTFTQAWAAAHTGRWTVDLFASTLTRGGSR